MEQLPWGGSGNSTMWRCSCRGEYFVYKEYTEHFRADVDEPRLQKLIDWRNDLPAGLRERLDAVAAWPRHRVKLDGILQGVLLPFAPAKFFDDSDTGPRPRMLAELIRLRYAGQLRKGGSREVKHAALGNAVEVLLWFHSQQVVVVDVRELNILCSLHGTDVYYVDCDVMKGPWGLVAPAAAPDYMGRAIPGLNRPGPDTDFARMAWMATAILLDTLRFAEIREDALGRVTDRESAQLLAAAGVPGPVDRDGWRRLADRWTSPPWVGTARVNAEATPDPSPPPGPGRLYGATLGPTRKMPTGTAEVNHGSFRVPDRFRLPDPVLAPPPSPVLPAPAAQPPWTGLSGRHRALLAGVLIAILTLCGLVTLSLSMGGATL